MDQVQFRGVEKAAIAQSIAAAESAITEFYMGKAVQADLEKFDFEALRNSILFAQNTEEIARIIRESKIEEFLERYRLVIETNALFEPNDPQQTSSKSDHAYNVYKTLCSWGAFEGVGANSSSLSVEEYNEIKAEIQIGIIFRYLQFIDQEDFNPRSPSYLRLKYFALNLNQHQKDLGTEISEKVGALYEKLYVKSKGPEAMDDLAADLAENPREIPIILAALQEMSGLNFKKVLYRDFNIFSRYTVKPHAQVERIDPAKLANQKAGVIQLLAIFKKTGDVVSVIDQPMAREGEQNPTLAFIARNHIAAKVASDFPSLAIRDIGGKLIEPPLPGIKF